MWSRKRLDIGWSDLGFALLTSLVPWRRFERACAAEQAIAEHFSPEGPALTCLSVRTSFDALLAALRLPAGSEVVMSALTIGDMPRIAREHGLVPVPVDIQMDEAAPSAADLERAITERTRLIVVAHLFGTRIDLDGYVAIARERGLLLVEDCAQAYAGPPERQGAAADVSMYSFGPIKTCTALGGAVLVVRDAALRTRVAEVLGSYSTASSAWYAQRVLKYGAIKVISLRGAFDLFIAACTFLRADYDRLLNRAARGFAGPDFFARIRRQPPAALLSTLARKLKRFDHERLERRVALARELHTAITFASRLRQQPERPFTTLAAPTVGANNCPGRSARVDAAWVFPVLTAAPQKLIDELAAAGFDATQGESMMAVAAPSADYREPLETQRYLKQVVYIPLYPELTAAAVAMLAVYLRKAAVEGGSSDHGGGHNAALFADAFAVCRIDNKVQ